MASRAKWLLCSLTCLVALLTAATYAQAVVQQPKDGCTSPDQYEGSLTSPPFIPTIGLNDVSSQITLQGWFEVESQVPTAFDTMTIEYSTLPASGQPRDWIAVDQNTTNPFVDRAAGGPNTSSAPDQPYSNQGTSVPPRYQTFTFDLPATLNDVPGVEFRIRFSTNDTTYQGFRGMGIDDVSADTTSVGVFPEGFEGGAGGWIFDPAASAGAPHWQVIDNSQNIAVRNPEVNPTLVTLPDAGALPGAATGTKFAWFGDTASGTFCGPDFASLDAAPDTSITDAPPASTASKDASFSFTASEQALFECQLDGGAFTFCASPQTYSALANGTHTFAVQATDFAGNVDPTPATYTWTIRPAILKDLDNPTLGVDVNVQEVSGKVLVGLTGAAARASGSGRASQKGITFVPLSEARQIPVGSFLDTRKGKAALESAANRAGKRQRGNFFNGLFQIRQSKKRSAKGLTDLVLKGSSFRGCGARRSSTDAGAALSRRQIRQLRANAKGRFRTSGRNSSATVRGTDWGVIDRCDGTLTKVRRGRVIVRDFRRKRNIVVTTGKSYFAKAPG